MSIDLTKMNPIEQFSHILDAADENSLYIKPIKIDSQDDLWEFLNRSVINQSIINDGKYMFLI